MLLRFRKTEPSPGAFRYLPYRKIAELLNRTVNEIAYIFTRATQSDTKQKKHEHLSRKLDKSHIEYLLDEIFAVWKLTRYDPEIEVEEFSESD